MEVVGPASQVRHVEGHVELRPANLRIRFGEGDGRTPSSNQETRRGKEGRAYGLGEVVEVDGGEAEEVVAAEPADGRHGITRRFLGSTRLLAAVPERNLVAGRRGAVSGFLILILSRGVWGRGC